MFPGWPIRLPTPAASSTSCAATRSTRSIATSNSILLTDEKATLDNIEHAFDDMAGRAKPGDLAFVFLAGHGVNLDGKYYFLPYDLPDLSPDTIRKHALTHDDLATRLSKFPTARVVVVLDTCYSGTFAANDSILSASRDDTLGKQMSHSTGRFILASSSSQQEALDGIDGHGVFAGVLLRGLLGAAHTGLGDGDHAKVSILEARRVHQGAGARRGRQDRSWPRAAAAMVLQWR